MLKRRKFDKDKIIIYTPRFLLRIVKTADITPRYIEWLNDLEVTKFIVKRRKKETVESVTKYVNEKWCSSNDFLFGIFTREDNRHIGNILLGKIDWYHRVGEISNLIGEKEYWGKGVGVEIDKFVIHFAFRDLLLRKIIFRVASGHRASIFKSRQLGFSLEGRLRKHAVLNGKFVDVLYFGILKDEFYTLFPDFK